MKTSSQNLKRDGVGAYTLGPVRIVRNDMLPRWRCWVWFDGRDQTIHSDGDETLRDAAFSAREYLREGPAAK
jgi:hypothetical protein